MQIVFFTGKKTGFLPVKNPLPFLPVKYKFYQLISETAPLKLRLNGAIEI